MPFQNSIRRTIGPFLDFIYPPRCLGCDATIRIEDVLCPQCLTEMIELPVTREQSDRHLARLTLAADATMMHAGYEYEAESIVEICIRTAKYRRMHRIAEWLGRLVGERIADGPATRDNPVVVPIPLHKLKRYERGYNQAEYIARGIAVECGLEMSPELLQRRRYTVSQSAAKLNRTDRKANIEHAFRIGSGIRATLSGRPIILVDDLVTTGATMNECASVLIDHGFTDIRYVAVAHPSGDTENELPAVGDTENKLPRTGKTRTGKTRTGKTGQ